MMNTIQRKLAVSAAGAFLLGMAWAPAAALEVPGGNFTIKEPQADAKRIPPKWKLVEGKAEDCTVWILPEGNGFSLKSGVTLETTVQVPELSEKESALKGAWSGIAHLDTWGLEEKGKGMISLQLLLEDSVIVEKKSRITETLAPQEGTKGPGILARHWEMISPKEMQSLAGKKITMRISSTGFKAVVVSGVGLCRVHSKPTKKLIGKANGHLGPDLLGAGSLGFEGLTVHKQHGLQVLTVRKDGPAETAGLKIGDTILEVNRQPLPENNLAPGWAWFEHSHEAVLGRAAAAAHGNKGLVELGIVRKGKMERLELRLAKPMQFTSMIPSEDPTAAALHQDLIDFLVRTQRKDGSWSGGPIRTSFSALALLATRDQAHAERVKRAVDYFLNRFPEAENYGNLGFWHASYGGILLSEYYLATGDDRVLGRLNDIRDWALTGTHTSKWGMPALGHGIGGLPYGQKALMAPLAHLVVYEALAKRTGMKSAIWEELFPYIQISWSDPAEKDGRGNPGHGAMGYNASYKDLGEFWSRSGLCAMACHLRGEHPEMRDALTKIMRERHPWIRNSHAYGEPGGAWGLLGLNLCAPDAYREVIKAYDWWFALAWEPGYGLRFTTPHMGAPYMGTDDLINATYALVLAAPAKTLHLTGATDRNWLDISKIPTLVSPVRVKRDKEGLVTLEGRIPGPEVRYTLDGSTPDANSTKYDGPFLLKEAATLKALTLRPDGQSGPLSEKNGPVAEVLFGPAKSTWKVVAASGHVEEAEALRRAARAIDGDTHQCWLTDNGEGSAGYPHFLVLDISEPTELTGLTLTFGDKNQAPGKWIVKASAGATEKPITIAEGTWEDFATSREITFSQPVKARYLRFEALTGVSESTTTLLVRELDLQL